MEPPPSRQRVLQRHTRAAVHRGNAEPILGLPERCSENMQGDAAVAEILRLAAMEKDVKKEEISEKNSLDEIVDSMSIFRT
jgi:hypothetical protein